MFALFKYSARGICLERTISSSLRYGVFSKHIATTKSTTSLVNILKWRTPCLLKQSENCIARNSINGRQFTSKITEKSKKLVGTWLMTCSGLVFLAVVLGGVTRISKSGLSMVTWSFTGEKMPLTEDSWIKEFELYKQYPEFKITNKDMTLDEFKWIWRMEYLHRMWGRLIGVAFFIPAGYFWMNKYLSPALKKRVLVLGSLIIGQGLMGWYMVKSGLQDRFHEPSDVPRVSQYRLAAHLSLAFLLYAGFLYNALDQLIPAKKIQIDYFGRHSPQLKLGKSLARFKHLANFSKGWVFLTAVSGAFVAGIDAGLVYNTFPKMANKWIPDDILAYTPKMINFTENPTTVQFDHRCLGITSLVLITSLGILSRKLKLPGRSSKAVKAVVGAAYLQVSLGIITLLSFVPSSLAALHQSGSLLLLSTTIWLCHELKHIKRLVK